MSLWAIKCFVPGTAPALTRWGRMREWVDDKSRRSLYPSRRAALCESAIANLTSDATIAFVKVSKKPKAPPPLKVGDDVTIRARVDFLQTTGGILVSIGSGMKLYAVLPTDCERVKP